MKFSGLSFRFQNLLVLFLGMYYFLFLDSFQILRSEVSVQILGQRNGGEFVFETGNRFPNLSGIAGGSRISFDRNYNLGGVGAKWFEKKWEISGQFTTTGWYTRTGQARDEDFFLYSVSKERAHHVDFQNFSYYDSTNIYSGTRNFADGIGKSSMFEYNFESFARYYLGDATSDIYTSGDGYFLSVGLSYTYNKYDFYDVNQWIATVPIFYEPIGYGLSFTNSILQSYYGFGYRWNWERFYIDSSFHVLSARIQTRDFHKQRNINFLSDTYGFGLLATLELGFKWNQSFLAFLKWNQHRFFTKGSFVADGGLSEGDILANYLGRYKAHINTKQWNIQLGGEYRLDWFRRDGSVLEKNNSAMNARAKPR